MSDLLTARLDGYGKALNLLSQRQKVLAGNVANADTPGFKARDFDFSAALAQARGQGIAPQVTSTRHLGGPSASGETDEARLQYRASEQPSLDGNTVDLDRERANFADNAMRYEATLRFINNDVRTMLSAITGQ
ncbi:flagellar basal body rod protein FlgB [uncultured Ramlibacter sp.]|uniref:flagellar basal body rod protein FlgB n=1 Tax=uncultured Ramlibacter sp. TaxID=260755 RepID=UPI002627412C|nr:flagellar basal body rod protein FlgB [uncultured Ramlibacter sp.]